MTMSREVNVLKRASVLINWFPVQTYCVQVIFVIGRVKHREELSNPSIFSVR